MLLIIDTQRFTSLTPPLLRTGLWPCSQYCCSSRSSKRCLAECECEGGEHVSMDMGRISGAKIWKENMLYIRLYGFTFPSQESSLLCSSTPMFFEVHLSHRFLCIYIYILHWCIHIYYIYIALHIYIRTYMYILHLCMLTLPGLNPS